MKTHPDTFLAQAEIGSRIPPYQPNFDFPGEYIDDYHRSIAELPRLDETLIQLRNRRWFGKVIKGWLRREDALKLYELAYFADGDVLELGTHHGLSTAIIARALEERGNGSLHSVDLDPRCVRMATRNLRWMTGSRRVTLQCAEAAAAVRQQAAAGKKYGFVFIDHSHAYAPVLEVCRELASVTAPGATCLFHDFNDERNREDGNADYGVSQAVIAGLDPAQFSFTGIYGCAALYQRVQAS